MKTAQKIVLFASIVSLVSIVGISDVYAVQEETENIHERLAFDFSEEGNSLKVTINEDMFHQRWGTDVRPAIYSFVIVEFENGNPTARAPYNLISMTSGTTNPFDMTTLEYVDYPHINIKDTTSELYMQWNDLKCDQEYGIRAEQSGNPSATWLEVIQDTFWYYRAC